MTNHEIVTNKLDPGWTDPWSTDPWKNGKWPDTSFTFADPCDHSRDAEYGWIGVRLLSCFVWPCFSGMSREACARVRPAGAGQLVLRVDVRQRALPRVRAAAAGCAPLVVTDVTVGQVFLCSGQSNMAFGLMSVANGALEAESARAAGQAEEAPRLSDERAPALLPVRFCSVGGLGARRRRGAGGQAQWRSRRAMRRPTWVLWTKSMYQVELL